MNWRWNMDFGGGQLMDWVGHHLDIAHWGLGWDETGPVEMEASGEYPTSGIYNSPTRYYATAKYADGTPLVMAGGYEEIWGGTKWIGEHGWIWVDRGQFETEPESLSARAIGPDEIRLYRSRDHYQNFLDCVRSARQDDHPRRDGPPLGERRPPGRHRHRGRPQDQVGPGDGDDHRRPRGRAPAQPRLPQALAAARVRREAMRKTHETSSKDMMRREAGAVPGRSSLALALIMPSAAGWSAAATATAQQAEPGQGRR